MRMSPEKRSQALVSMTPCGTHLARAVRLRRYSLAVLAGLSTGMMYQEAAAQNVALSFSGTLNQGSTDQLGYFGPVNGDLSNLPFTVSVSYNPTNFSLASNGDYQSVDTGAISFVLTINGKSYTFVSQASSPPGQVTADEANGSFNTSGFTGYNEAWCGTQSPCYPPYFGFSYIPSTTFSFTDPPNPSLGSSVQLSIYNGNSGDFFFATSGSLSFVSPFLLGAKSLGDIDLATLLPNLQAPASALGLAADGTSAAIVLFQVSNTLPVTFTTNNGTTLLPYDPHFMQKTPAQGGTTLTPVTPIQIGSLIYALALLQTPTAGITPTYSAPIVVTAHQEGGQVQQATIPLVPPPVFLVHGLWGDLTSLSNLQAYLITQAPWSSDSSLIQPICYSKAIKFDAKTDPLTNGQECEWTSKVGLQTAITPTLAQYQQQGVVVGRVDAVSHSMGGLAIRSYASQNFYRSPTNRMQGQFHTIVTLDTPETGSELATFLINNKDNDRQRPGDPIWSFFCKLRTGPLEKCFELQRMPITTKGVSLADTAVYSLEPNSKSLTNKELVSPNIPGAIWRAVSATAPDNSALEGVLNDLMTEITPEGQTAPTVSGELQTTSHDAIVTTESQTAGASGGQITAFSNLSHSSIMLPKKLVKLNKWNDDSVVDDPTGAINQTVACLLQSAGVAACAPPASKIVEIAYKPETTIAGTQTENSIAVQAPKYAELGTPVELAVHGVRVAFVKEITVTQDENNRLNKGCSRTASLAHTDVDTVYVRVMPCVLGEATFHVEVESTDGRLDEGEAQILIRPPLAAPTSFKLSQFNTLFIDLDNEAPILPTYPTATFAGIPWTLRIPSQFITYDLAPGSPIPVVSVGQHGLIRGLHVGTAVVEAHFGQATDKVHVVVQHQGQSSP